MVVRRYTFWALAIGLFFTAGGDLRAADESPKQTPAQPPAKTKQEHSIPKLANVKIRFARTADIGVVEGMEILYSNNVQSVGAIEKAIEAGRVIIAEKDGFPEGYLIFSKRPKGVTLDSAVVSPDLRRQGIGSQLIDFIKGNMANEDWKTARIIVSEKDNLPAVLFAKDNGFRHVRTKNKNSNDPKYVMEHKPTGRGLDTADLSTLTYYDWLGVAPDAGQKELNLAFALRSLTYKNNPGILAALTRAHTFLSDPQKRALYDSGVYAVVEGSTHKPETSYSPKGSVGEPMPVLPVGDAQFKDAVYYKILGSAENASSAKIERDYQAALKRFANDPQALEAIRKAHAVLGDEGTRKAYDRMVFRYGKEALHVFQPSAPFDLDLYRRIGGSPRSTYRRLREGYDRALVEHAGDLSALLALGEAWSVLAGKETRQEYDLSDEIRVPSEANHLAIGRLQKPASLREWIGDIERFVFDPSITPETQSKLITRFAELKKEWDKTSPQFEEAFEVLQKWEHLRSKIAEAKTQGPEINQQIKFNYEDLEMHLRMAHANLAYTVRQLAESPQQIQRLVTFYRSFPANYPIRNEVESDCAQRLGDLAPPPPEAPSDDAPKGND